MTNVTPKAVSTIIFGAAAVSIGYRIATSPERKPRNTAPCKDMTSRGKRRKAAVVEELQPVETSIPMDGDEHPRARSVPPAGAEGLGVRRRQALPPSDISIGLVADAKPTSNLRATSGGPGRISPSCLSKPYAPSPPLSPLPDERTARRRRKERGLRGWAGFEFGERTAYGVAIALFIATIITMAGIDRFHEHRRKMIPATITSVLFIEPLEKYSAMQIVLDTISSKVDQARNDIEEFAKSITKCNGHEVGFQHREQWAFAGVVHPLKDDLVQFKLRAPKMVANEKAWICKDIALLQARLGKHAADSQIIKTMVEDMLLERESHALSILQYTTADKAQLDKINIKSASVWNDRAELAKILPDAEPSKYLVGSLRSLPQLDEDLKELHRNLDTSPELLMGKAFVTVEKGSFDVARRSKLLHRWLSGKKIERQRLLEQVESIAQHKLVRDICEQRSVETKKADSLRGDPSKAAVFQASWLVHGKDAMCQKICGSI